jgi:hypothetical protein
MKLIILKQQTKKANWDEDTNLHTFRNSAPEEQSGWATLKKSSQCPLNVRFTELKSYSGKDK